MKFRNIATGNIVRTSNEITIALMTKSANYEVVSDKSAKGDKKTEMPAK